MRNENVEPFAPGGTVSLAVSASSAGVLLPNAAGMVKQQVRLYNAGSALVFVKIAGLDGAAALTDMPIPSGVIEVLTLLPAQSARYVYAICASGTATLYATVGEGV